MIAILALIFAAVLIWIFVVHLREQSPPAMTPPQVQAPSRRFSGRVVPPPAAIVQPQAARPSSRLRNGRKVSPARSTGPLANGRTFTPENAIGLGCLRPISECTLGNRCVCRTDPRPPRSGL